MALGQDILKQNKQRQIPLKNNENKMRMNFSEPLIGDGHQTARQGNERNEQIADGKHPRSPQTSVMSGPRLFSLRVFFSLSFFKLLAVELEIK